MDNNTEFAELTTTPRRTRRSSAMELGPASQHKRSTRKTVLPEIEETKNAHSSDPVTPSRSLRVLDFQTPSRSNALAAAQTPRRSVRKSIKPLQEYENIVAQKGLSAKRAASSSIEDEAEPTEGKWMPAVIGRASTKRSKKAKRAKKKQLQRQQKIAEGQATDMGGSLDRQQLNDDREKKLDVANDAIALHADDKLIDNYDDDKQCNGNQILDVKPCDDENLSGNTEKPVAELPNEDVIDKTSKDEDKENNKQEIAEEANVEVPKETPTSEIHKDGNAEVDVSDSSMDEGDIEMETIPITADDMESPAKHFHFTPTVASSNKNLNVVTKADSVNKSNDSDCIMLESFQAEQSDSGVTNLKSIHDSCDSIETNMPPLLVCSDDEEDQPEMQTNAITPKQNEQPEDKVSTPESDPIISLDGTFEVDESPTKNAEQITPQMPKLRPSITRIPTPFKSSKAIISEKISEEETDSEDIPEIVLEPREIALKSIRKRSLSICAVRPRKVVTFQCPVNTTVSVYDSDLMKGTSKDDTDNITQRRKRSLSVTETEREMMAYFEQTETAENTPDKRRKLAQPRSRTKMPNFSAIHQHQFQRMESIADHVARKAERAKILSASKVRPASIQKGLPVKNSVLRDSNKDAAGNKVTLPVPKARQRIELSGIEHKPKIDTNKRLYSGMKVHSRSKPDLSTLDDFPSIGKVSSKMNASTSVLTNMKPIHLPKPKFDATMDSLPSIGKISSKMNTNISVFTATTNPVHLPKPRFDTNTSTLNAPLNSTKLGDRRKRMMDMYKARTEPRTGERNKEILKGVRTNRRFELQMMCRNRPN